MKRKTKETIGEAVGNVVGCTSSIIGATNLISALGVVPGLSGPGISAGLYAIGFGSMFGGVAVIAVATTAITIGAGYAGYCLSKKF